MRIEAQNGTYGRKTLRALARSALFRLKNPTKASFDCPVCRYHGPFQDISPATGTRLHARCPLCGALERHRLQHLTLEVVLSRLDARSMRMLHFAPETFFAERFRSTFGSYETADIAMPGVDHHVDLQSLPFDSASYDIVYASHVLEHIPDDRAAISEIRRILTPGGLAILPVPLVAPVTIEYPEPNPFESMHVRAPGTDYFERLRPHFSSVDLHSSDSYPPSHQLYVYEDRATAHPQSPLRPSMPGKRHPDTVPVCTA